jgi:hypothetical protein
MKSRLIVCAGIVTLIATSWVQAQQGPFSPPAPSAQPTLSGTDYTPPVQHRLSLPASPTRPPAAPYTQSIPGEVVQEPGVPHYPYPPYPNPFYDGSARPNPLSEGVDWLRDLPSNVAHRFSTFVDTTLFPKKAATHGGPPSGPPAAPPAAQPQPFAPQAPQSSGLLPSLQGLLPGTR